MNMNAKRVHFITERVCHFYEIIIIPIQIRLSSKFVCDLLVILLVPTVHSLHHIFFGIRCCQLLRLQFGSHRLALNSLKAN